LQIRRTRDISQLAPLLPNLFETEPRSEIQTWTVGEL